MSKRNRKQAVQEEILNGPAVETAPAEGTAISEAAAPAEGAANPEVQPSANVVPIHLGKYAASEEKTQGAIPSTFKYRDVPLYANLKPQERSTKEGVLSKPSVRLRIWNMVFSNPGITGAELVELMKLQDWTGHPSAYTKGGKVCTNWCSDYVTGQLRKKRNHLTTVVPEAGSLDEELNDE
jgi:hypothetical protein